MAMSKRPQIPFRFRHEQLLDLADWLAKIAMDDDTPTSELQAAAKAYQEARKK